MENNLTENILKVRSFEHFEEGHFNFWRKGTVIVQQHGDRFCIPGSDKELTTLSDLESFYFRNTGQNL